MFYVAEIHAGLFNNPMVVAAPPTGGWRFFAYCEQDDIQTCALLFNDLAGFQANAQNNFLLLMDHLLERGTSGKPWAVIFQDGGVFHSVHKFAVERIDPKTGKKSKKDCEVLQFKKKRTSVRVLFIYTDKRLIAFLTSAFEKHTDKTPAREQARAEAIVKDFFSAVDSQTIQLIQAQGGKNATQGLFY